MSTIFFRAAFSKPWPQPVHGRARVESDVWEPQTHGVRMHRIGIANTLAERTRQRIQGSEGKVNVAR